MNIFPFLNLREAAFVLDMEHEVVLRELDAHPEYVEKRNLPIGLVRHLQLRDMVFLRLIQNGKGIFSAAGKDELYQALVLAEESSGRFQFREAFFVDITKISEEFKDRLALLEQVRASVEMNDEGPPTVKGTRIEVYRVAALASTSPEEAKFEYPSLSHEQIKLASQYASVYPKTGRPFPVHSLKRKLLNADFGELNKAVAAGRKAGKIYEGDKRAPKGSPEKNKTTGTKRRVEK